MAKSLKRGILVVLVANLINLALSLAKNFILPKYLPVSTYADIKAYQLIIGYAGLFALGYVDGMYLKYGGKDISEVDQGEFGTSLSTFRIFQIVISVISAAVGLAFHSIVAVAAGLTIAFLNIADYYKCFFQAVGEFDLYSRIMNVTSIALFVLSITLLFVFGLTDSCWFLYGYAAIYAVIWLVIEVVFRKKARIRVRLTKFSVETLKETIVSGFALMIGLLLSNLLLGLGQWFAMGTTDTRSFALYSFAASVLGFLNYAVSPVSVTLYNHFCNKHSREDVDYIRGFVCILSVAALLAAFPVKAILDYYLFEYVEAWLPVVLLFASQPVYILIKCVYVNLYKATKRQKQFFKRTVQVVIFGIVVDILFYLVLQEVYAYALGSFATALLWLILSCLDFDRGNIPVREILYLAVCMGGFLLFAMTFGLYGIAGYFALIVVSSLTLMKGTAKEIIRLLDGRIHGLLKKN